MNPRASICPFVADLQDIEAWAGFQVLSLAKAFSKPPLPCPEKSAHIQNRLEAVPVNCVCAATPHGCKTSAVSYHTENNLFFSVFFQYIETKGRKSQVTLYLYPENQLIFKEISVLKLHLHIYSVFFQYDYRYYKLERWCRKVHD